MSFYAGRTLAATPQNNMPTAFNMCDMWKYFVNTICFLSDCGNSFKNKVVPSFNARDNTIHNKHLKFDYCFVGLYDGFDSCWMIRNTHIFMKKKNSVVIIFLFCPSTQELVLIHPSTVMFTSINGLWCIILKHVERRNTHCQV